MAQNTVYRARHRRPVNGNTAKAGAAALLVSAVVLAGGAGAAMAAPGQPGTSGGQDSGQGGTTAPGGGGGQGGTTGGGSGGQGGTTAPPAPRPDTGPGVVPDPPAEPQDDPTTNWTPEYDTPYSPIPETLHAPRPTPPVKRKTAPPNRIRVGNFVTPIPPGMPIEQVRSINRWAAYGEAEIARQLISVGVPPDQASRRAAATIIGVAVGGAAGAGVGAAIGAVPGAVIGLPLGVAAGAGIGAGVSASLSLVPPFGAVVAPALVGIGAVIGAPIGTVAGAAVGAGAGAVSGAVVGAVIGGALAYALGAGDPGAHPPRPDKPGVTDNDYPDEGTPKQDIQPAHRGPVVYQVQIPSDHARRLGLPAVDYTVTTTDVNVRVGGQSVGWTRDQAMAPIRALGAAAPAAEKAMNDVAQGARRLQAVVPGLKVDFPHDHRGRR